jgi:hypothetical protein
MESTNLTANSPCKTSSNERIFLAGVPQTKEYSDWKEYIDHELIQFTEKKQWKHFGKFVCQFINFSDSRLRFLPFLTDYVLSRLSSFFSSMSSQKYDGMIMKIVESSYSRISSEKIFEFCKELYNRQENRRRVVKIIDSVFIENCSESNLKLLHEFIIFHGIEGEIDLDRLITIQNNRQRIQKFICDLSQNKDQFYLFLKAFKVRDESMVRFIAKIITKEEFPVQDYEFIFVYSRIKSISYYFYKFGWAILEEKITNNIDLGCFLSHLVKKKKLREAFSIWWRLGPVYKLSLPPELSNLTFEECYTSNPMLQLDRFHPTSENLNESSTINYVKLSDFSYQESDVVLVDQSNINYARSELESVFRVGIDAEFYRKDFHTISQNILATIQIACESKIFIFDAISLIGDETFEQTLTNLLRNENIEKLGFAFHNDIEVFQRSFPNVLFEINNLIDFGYDSNTKQNISLAHYVVQFFQKPLCKFEQGSGWQNRPLRKAQIHYAALDAAVCLQFYHHLEQIPLKRMINFKQTANPNETGVDHSNKKSKKRKRAKKAKKVSLFYENYATLKDKKSISIDENKTPKKDYEVRISGINAIGYSYDRDLKICIDKKFDLNSNYPLQKYKIDSNTQNLSDLNNYKVSIEMYSKNKKPETVYYKKEEQYTPVKPIENQGDRKYLFCDEDSPQKSQKDDFKPRNYNNNYSKYDHYEEKSYSKKERTPDDRPREYKAVAEFTQKPTIREEWTPKQQSFEKIDIFVADSSFKHLISKMRKFGISIFSTSQLPINFVGMKVVYLVQSYTSTKSIKECTDIYKPKESEVLSQFYEICSRYNIKTSKKDYMTRCIACNSTNFDIVAPDNKKAYEALINKSPNPNADFVWQCYSCRGTFYEGCLP